MHSLASSQSAAKYIPSVDLEQKNLTQLKSCEFSHPPLGIGLELELILVKMCTVNFG